MSDLQELLRDADSRVVDQAELGSTGSAADAYRTGIPVAETVAPDRVRFDPSAFVRLVDEPVENGDLVVIDGSAAAGRYTIAEITGPHELRVLEPIPSAPGGTAELRNPPGASRVGLDPDEAGLAAGTVQGALRELADRGGALGFYGDGSDGSAVLPVGVTVIERDMFWQDLRVPGGAVLQVGVGAAQNNFRLHVRGTLTIEPGGVITASGESASGATAGTAPNENFGSIGTGGAGGAGGLVGAAGSDVSAAYGGSGGAGGAGSVGAAGPGGLATAPPPETGGARSLPLAAVGKVVGFSAVATVVGGAGGGGGGGDGVNLGGGGGAGGGALVLCARHIVNGGDILALGGDGAPGTAGDAGGGGGGGGGTLALVYDTLVGLPGFISVDGGPGGAGSGTGAAGQPGQPGTRIDLPMRG